MNQEEAIVELAKLLRAQRNRLDGLTIAARVLVRERMADDEFREAVEHEMHRYTSLLQDTRRAAEIEFEVARIFDRTSLHPSGPARPEE